MGRLKLPSFFTPKTSPILQRLVQTPTTTTINNNNNGFSNWVSVLLHSLKPGYKKGGGLRTEEEEKVYSWLYALALTDKNLAFEYVQSTERGLSFTEADRRLRGNGPNVPVEYTSPSWGLLMWNALFHPFNVILIVLSTLSYITYDNLNGCIMLVLVFISVSLRFYHEYSSTKAALKLSEYLRYPVKVQRCAGRLVQQEVTTQVDQKDIVAGDIILIEPGDLFPGDVRLLTSNQLIVSQSSLTGESGVVEKTADIIEDQSTPLLELRNICFMVGLVLALWSSLFMFDPHDKKSCCCKLRISRNSIPYVRFLLAAMQWMGTAVMSGTGTGLVVSTGSKTYMSTMFSAIGLQKSADDFEIGIRHISYILVGVMLLIATIIGLTDYFMTSAASESVLFSISVACALTPQMLPLITNTCLAKGAIAMARARCIVKSVNAIQDMGSMDILCIDKTGTLTINCVTMSSYLDMWGLPKEDVLQFAFLNAYFKSEHKNPVDDAVLSYVYMNGYRFSPSKWRKIGEIPFDFVRRTASVILETGYVDEDQNGQLLSQYIITKGALEEVIRISSYIGHSDGASIRALAAEDYQRIQIMGEELSKYGLRVLGVAMKKLETQTGTEGKFDIYAEESNMLLLGLVTFYDPPKDSAKQALWRLAEKGVKAKVLTGDSLTLAIRICEEVGIETTHVLTGPELELLNHEAFHEAVKEATVLARLTPTQKQRVVLSLQDAGDHVVGFLGDGINDSLALEAANVGISVDSGASIAKQFADIILLEKDLNVLVAGVEEGRFTFKNTMKYIKMSVIANIGGVLSLLIAIFFLRFEPLTPKQLLTQNFLYSLGQITIPWDKVEAQYVEKPQRWSRTDLPIFILWNSTISSLCDVATLMFVWFYYQAYSILEKEFFRSALFVEGLLMQTLIIHLIRTEKIPFIQEVASWPVVFSTVLFSAVGIAIPFTPIGEVMGFAHLPLTYLGFLVVLFLGYLFIGQLVKKLYICVYRKWL